MFRRGKSNGLRDIFHATYDATVDGQRFAMIRISDQGTADEELIVAENWFKELQRLSPPN